MTPSLAPALRVSRRTGDSHPLQLAADVFALGKPGITAMAVLATAWGYRVARPPHLDGTHLALVLLATWLVSAGSCTLNQVLERDVDALMPRTRQRPLPANRIPPAQATLVGGAQAATGIALLGMAANGLSLAIGLGVVVAYVGIYTPLKRLTTLNPLAGAIPGAAPPVLGWVAAGRELDSQAVALFLVLYAWQLPHVLAIAWRYKDDYAAAGLRMVSVGGTPRRRTRVLLVLSSLALMLASLAPVTSGLAGSLYAGGVLAADGLLFVVALRLAHTLSERSARLLFLVTLVYLPLVMGLLLCDLS